MVTTGQTDTIEKQGFTNRDRRLHDRMSVQLRAFVHCHGVFKPTVVLNMSRGGAKLQDVFGLMPRDNVEIELLSGRRIPARIVWVMAGRCGVAFSELLTEDDELLLATAKSA